MCIRDSISSLSGDGKSLLYVGTDGNGVHFVSTDKKKVVRSMRHETGKDETWRSKSVYSVLVDKEGLIWVGFYQLGLEMCIRDRLKRLKEKQSVLANL